MKTKHLTLLSPPIHLSIFILKENVSVNSLSEIQQIQTKLPTVIFHQYFAVIFINKKKLSLKSSVYIERNNPSVYIEEIPSKIYIYIKKKTSYVRVSFYYVRNKWKLHTEAHNGSFFISIICSKNH